jgi:hypothetical protein
MRPEVQVLPGPQHAEPVHLAPGTEEVHLVKKPLVFLVAVAAAATAVIKRRQGQADAALWREATSDSSR